MGIWEHYSFSPSQLSRFIGLLLWNCVPSGCAQDGPLWKITLCFLFQRVFYHLVYGIHEYEFHFFAQVLGHIFDIMLVLLG